MDTTKKPRRRFRTPMRTISSEDMDIILRRSIYGFEMKYGMSSAEMLKKISSGEEEDTPEILKWMMDYHALRLNDQTPTSGKHSSSIE